MLRIVIYVEVDTAASAAESQPLGRWFLYVYGEPGWSIQQFGLEAAHTLARHLPDELWRRVMMTVQMFRAVYSSQLWRAPHTVPLVLYHPGFQNITTLQNPDGFTSLSMYIRVPDRFMDPNLLES